MNPKFRFSLHNLVKYLAYLEDFSKLMGKDLNHMKGKASPQKRKKIQRKIALALKEDMKSLSKELQEILADDLVTAFQNRMTVFTKIQAKKR